MGENSKIEWTDHTFNPWIGCTKVAAGCAHCYAERDMDHRLGIAQWGPAGTRVKTSAANWARPLKWNREAEAAGERRRVFCASLADVFEEWGGTIMNSYGNALYSGPHIRYATMDEALAAKSYGVDVSPATMDDLRRDLFRLIDATPSLDWLLVTKRPENIRRMWAVLYGDSPLRGETPVDRLLNDLVPRRSNVCLLTSIANQADADKNISDLLKCRDLVPGLGVSAEPLLGPLALDPQLSTLDWMIVGGESGPHARPCHPEWVRSIRDQCRAAGVPFFLKQWGEWAPRENFAEVPDCLYGEWHSDGGEFTECCLCCDGRGTMFRVGKKLAGRVLDGRTWDEFPKVSEP